MPYKTPADIAAAGVQAGITKSRLSWDRALVGGFLAGAYIALAALLAIVASAGMNPATWGGVQTLVTGAAFSLGLVLVVIAGSELLTGNMALLPLGVLARRVTLRGLGRNFGLVLVGNLIGSLFVAYFLAVKTGVVTAPADLARLAGIATAKAVTETDPQIFLRALGCNWLVCLAVWMALGADDIGGKILAIIFPITGFVAMGFDHVVANMFFLPAAIFAHVPGISWGDALNNWAFALMGNFVGAAVFVSGAYWFLYVRGATTTSANVDTAPARNGAENGAERNGAPHPWGESARSA
jgi:formate/nitrite transporter